MRTIRIYQNQPLSIGQSLTLDTEASKHIATVLRKRVGEQITLFNGNGFDYQALITAITKKFVTVALESQIAINKESPLRIHLAQAIGKADKMDFVIQKATELGVNYITPLITERSIVKLDQDRLEKKLEHWQKIAISACEQCGRSTLPTIYPPTNLPCFIKTHSAEPMLILHPENGQSLASITDKLTAVTLLIGPEGGFSETELNLTQANNCSKILLGPRILRTETAPLVAITLLQARWGDL